MLEIFPFAADAYFTTNKQEFTTGMLLIKTGREKNYLQNKCAILYIYNTLYWYQTIPSKYRQY